MRWFSSLFQAAAIVLILVGASVAGEAPKFRVYLTAEETEGVPTGKPSTEFGCRDTVYAVVQATDLKLGSHVLEASWIDPQRNQRERTRHPFEARQKATTCGCGYACTPQPTPLSPVYSTRQLEWANSLGIGR
ncbi:MAG: hypothetical protein OEU36_20425 [Gammaproteobacteria bacterium]|nr:hypothetical protein [Gammaproteobacteria bacterium]